MPRKAQGWITFQTSPEERQLLEEICQVSQRTKTEVLRELLRGLRDSTSEPPHESENEALESLQPQAPQHQVAASAAAPASKKPLKVSSRNILEGRITRIVKGSVNTEVTLEIIHRVELTSIITTSSAEALELAEGKSAYAMIKSSDVVIAMD